jgi:hypothetical protein
MFSLPSMETIDLMEFRDCDHCGERDACNGQVCLMAAPRDQEGAD